MCNNLSDIVSVLADQGIPLEQSLSSGLWVRLTERLESFVGRLDSGIGVVCCAVWCGGPNFAIAWIVNIESLSGLGLNPFASNEGFVAEDLAILELFHDCVSLSKVKFGLNSDEWFTLKGSSELMVASFVFVSAFILRLFDVLASLSRDRCICKSEKRNRKTMGTGIKVGESTNIYVSPSCPAKQLLVLHTQFVDPGRGGYRGDISAASWQITARLHHSQYQSERLDCSVEKRNPTLSGQTEKCLNSISLIY